MKETFLILYNLWNRVLSRNIYTTWNYVLHLQQLENIIHWCIQWCPFNCTCLNKIPYYNYILALRRVKNWKLEYVRLRKIITKNSVSGCHFLNKHSNSVLGSHKNLFTTHFSICFIKSISYRRVCRCIFWLKKFY